MELLKVQLRRLAARVMGANPQGLPRMNAVTYFSTALEAYRALEPQGS